MGRGHQQGQEQSRRGFFGKTERKDSGLELLPVTSGRNPNPSFSPAAGHISEGTVHALTKFAPPAAAGAVDLNEQMQQESNAHLAEFFGGYLLRGVNPLHRSAVRARLCLWSGSLANNYYGYCYKSREQAYDQTLGLSRQDIEDHQFEKEHGQHLLGLVLPQLPTYTSDPKLNKANHAINQANWLLEQRVRAFIRRELANLKKKGLDPEAGDCYDALFTKLLFEMQDPDVKWVRLSDAGIAAGLLLEQESVLFKMYGDVRYETRVNIPEGKSVKSDSNAMPEVLSVFRPSVAAVGRAPVTVVMPGEEGYYLAPVSNPAYGFPDDGQAYDNVAENGSRLPGAVDGGFVDDQAFAALATYDLADRTPENFDGFSQQQDDYDLATQEDQEGEEFDGPVNYDLASPADRATNTSSAAEPTYAKPDKKAKTGKAKSPSAQETVPPPPLRQQAVDPFADVQGYQVPFSADAVKDGTGADDAEDPFADVQGYQEIDAGDPEGYLQVDPAAVPPSREASTASHDSGKGASEELRSTPPSSLGSHGTPPSAPRLPPPRRESRPRAAIPIEAFAAPEAPIPPNPFLKKGEQDSNLLPTTMYLGLVPAIRDAIQEKPGSNSLADLVRQQERRLKDAGQSAPELRAIQICARIANQALAACPGFNYLAGLQVSDVQYKALFDAMTSTVTAYREYFAAEERSVPNRPNQRVLNDNMDNVTPFMKAFIDLYLAELAESAKNSLAFQFAVVARSSLDGKKIDKNFRIVVKRAKAEGGCTQINYQLLIDDTTSVAQFKENRHLYFTSYDATDNHQANASPTESFGDNPNHYSYRDKDNTVHDVIAGANIPSPKGVPADQFKVNLPPALKDEMAKSAIQQAYRQQEGYELAKRAGRWLLMHPKLLAGVAAGAVVVGAAAGAYAAGAFDPAPCKGYLNGQGGCVNAELPDAQCSLVVSTPDTLEGGSVRLTPSCQNLAAFSASSQRFTITNLPAGSQVSVNGQVVVASSPIGDFDATPYINQEMTIVLPNGFNGNWTPQANTQFVSGAKSASAAASASQSVRVEPVAGTATVSLTQGSFTGLVENGNATFTMQWNPAPGDASVQKFVRNLPVGDRLCDANNPSNCFISTSDNGGQGQLNFSGRSTRLMYIPKVGASGPRAFELYAKSVDGAIVGAESAPFSIQYDIQGIADVPELLEVPSVLYTVQGQASPPFNLTALAAEGDNLQKAVILPPASSLCGTLRANDAPVCLSNTGASNQEFDISTWKDLVTYQGSQGFTFRARGEVDGSVSTWVSSPVTIDQLNTPTVTFTQGSNPAPVSQVTFDEDTLVSVNLGLDLQNADSASVVLQFPSVTTDFAAGSFQVNGTLGTGFDVTAEVNPGQSLDVSNWNLAEPVGIIPPENVNRGNQAGNINLGVHVVSHTDDGRSTTVDRVLGLSVVPVVDDFSFVSNIDTAFHGFFTVRRNQFKGFNDQITSAAIPGEQVSSLTMSQLPPGVNLIDVRIGSDPLPLNPDGTSTLDPAKAELSRYAFYANGSPEPVLGNYSMSHTACVTDGAVEACSQKPFILGITS